MNINILIEEIREEDNKFISKINEEECSYKYVISTGDQLLGNMVILDKLLEDNPNKKHTFEKMEEQIIGIIIGKTNSIISEFLAKY